MNFVIYLGIIFFSLCAILGFIVMTLSSLDEEPEGVIIGFVSFAVSALVLFGISNYCDNCGWEKSHETCILEELTKDQCECNNHHSCDCNKKDNEEYQLFCKECHKITTITDENIIVTTCPECKVELEMMDKYYNEMESNLNIESSSTKSTSTNNQFSYCYGCGEKINNEVMNYHYCPYCGINIQN